MLRARPSGRVAAALVLAAIAVALRAGAVAPWLGPGEARDGGTAMAPAPTESDPTEATLVGAGDIAVCDGDSDEATARLLDAIPGTVFAVGDNAYERGTAREFDRCYGPTWGRHRARTRPAAGNHDYGVRGAAAYFRYFGAAAGEPGKGYYSYDLGAWHVVVLNSSCAAVGGCGVGSAQERWLRHDLDSHPSSCALAYWHHPRFSSGEHGDEPAMQAIWQALYDAGAEFVVSGHDHDYERFAPRDAHGTIDTEHGVRQFVVGTGGRALSPFTRPAGEASEARDHGAHGVLKLTLTPSSYRWEFIPTIVGGFTDSGAAPCHGAPGP